MEAQLLVFWAAGALLAAVPLLELQAQLWRLGPKTWVSGQLWRLRAKAWVSRGVVSYWLVATQTVAVLLPALLAFVVQPFPQAAPPLPFASSPRVFVAPSAAAELQPLPPAGGLLWELVLPKCSIAKAAGAHAVAKGGQLAELPVAMCLPIARAALLTCCPSFLLKPVLFQAFPIVCLLFQHGFSSPGFFLPTFFCFFPSFILKGSELRSFQFKLSLFVLFCLLLFLCQLSLSLLCQLFLL